MGIIVNYNGNNQSRNNLLVVVYTVTKEKPNQNTLLIPKMAASNETNGYAP